MVPATHAARAGLVLAPVVDQLEEAERMVARFAVPDEERIKQRPAFLVAGAVLDVDRPEALRPAVPPVLLEEERAEVFALLQRAVGRELPHADRPGILFLAAQRQHRDERSEQHPGWMSGNHAWWTG
jgi:hypothetical protein